MIVKAFWFVSLALFAASIFLPWLWELGESPLAIYPPIYVFGQFWSFQAIIQVFSGSRLTGFYILRFQEYWFDRMFFGYPNVFAGWMLVFLLQILVTATGVIRVVRKEGKLHLFASTCTVAASVVALVLGYYEFIQHSDLGRGYGWQTVGFDKGFFLALSSVLLWLVSLLIQLWFRKSVIGTRKP